jgi:hypothetical protein
MKYSSSLLHKEDKKEVKSEERKTKNKNKKIPKG